MDIADEILPLYKQKDWAACHRLLDGALPGDSPEQRHSIAHWRAATFKWEGRYREALDVLSRHRGDFNCKTSVCDMRARIYDNIGETGNAIDELRSAPFGEEMGRFPGLVMDAIYFYCFLLAREGREVPAKLLEAIPEDYVSMIVPGAFVDKARILAMMDENAAKRAARAASRL